MSVDRHFGWTYGTPSLTNLQLEVLGCGLQDRIPVPPRSRPGAGNLGDATESSQTVVLKGKTFSYTNPYTDGNKHIFIYFDPVHLWKNIYSSFHSNACMVLTRCPGAEEPERMRTALFSSWKVLARWENYKSVKASYKFTQKVLARSSIEKQSIGLIMAVVNHNTVTRLRLLAMTRVKEEHSRHPVDVPEDKGELEMGRAVLKGHLSPWPTWHPLECYCGTP
ncbi:uncharacterized protein LOC130922804 [Corythoichthys intestinalis]|uniref:uncharacterized protein LOC130922804 n=1 Tax=Corythoichthys intestinalis TaxID=161448 RepID=UPI0025A67BDE|nr:uncharacterized protein LOC130922804 [Corythoichthys intestinalis]